jgi:hypothetical protein
MAGSRKEEDRGTKPAGAVPEEARVLELDFPNFLISTTN